MNIRSSTLYLVLLLCLIASTVALAEERAQPNLDGQVQNLKREVLKLNRELFLLEEELLFPSSTQVTVFVSLDTGAYFKLDSVELKLDDEVVASYLYTEREVNALSRGGVQRLYTGNLKTGDHELVAFFIGKGPEGRPYKRAASLTINKALSPKFVELKIVDNSDTQQPDFNIAQW